MRAILLALMLALAGVGLVALVPEEAAAQVPCDRNVIGGVRCCWYIDDENRIHWRPC